MLLLLFLPLQQLGLHLIRQNDVSYPLFLAQFPVCSQSSPSIPLLFVHLRILPRQRPRVVGKVVVMMIPTPIPMSRTISSFSVHLLSICIQILVWMGLLSCILHNLILHLDFVLVLCTPSQYVIKCR